MENFRQIAPPGLESIKFFRKIFKLTQGENEQNKTTLKKKTNSLFSQNTQDVKKERKKSSDSLGKGLYQNPKGF